MSATAPRLHVVRAAGVSLVVAERAHGLPELVHLGADLGAADELADLLPASGPPVPRSALDAPWPLTVLPGEADGWSGRPGFAGHRHGAAVVPRWQATVGTEPGALLIEATDEVAGVALVTRLALDSHGVLVVGHTLRNTGADVLDVAGLLAVAPVPPQATETLDLTGRWCRERSPLRLPLVHGGRVRESRRGRTGHDATLLLIAGTAGFDFGSGEVLACHVAWSGDHVHLVDRLPEGAGRHAGVLGGGELLRAGEVRLARIGALVDTAAALGVERVVLDDGWFLGRRDDGAGLGDWVVDPDVWPTGLAPFADRVRSHGMQVGVWVEPEMVNLDSDVVRAHPDWLLAPSGPDGSVGGALPWRRQQVLDLTRPEAFDHVLGQLDAMVTAERPAYLKWDHNRDLHEAVAAGGGAGVHRQTLAAYRLMDELRARHPGLEVESCASGGARVDLGVLARTQRVWASDCNDPVERQAIQRWTGLLLPPELVGTHVGPTHSHTTGRVTDLDLRCLTALFGHAGIEWDVVSCTDEERERLAGWIVLHKRLRLLLHGGRTVRGEERDGAWLHGVVSPGRDHAVYAFVRLVSGADAVPGLVRLPGLEETRRYRVRAVDVTGRDEVRLLGAAGAQPAWCTGEGLVVPGTVLVRHGLAMPVLDPEAGVLLEVTVEG